MAGHSKWAQIKRKKAVTDEKRSKIFSKTARLIAVESKKAKGDTQAPGLRLAIQKAKEVNMPAENIERAVRKGREDTTAGMEEVVYEAYGPGGSAFLLSGLTDNSNRTTNEIKHILDDRGGRLATAGSVLWLFEKKMVFEFVVAPDRELELIDAGAEDTALEGETIRALVDPANGNTFAERIKRMNFEPTRSFIAALPKTTVVLLGEDREKAVSLAEALEDHDDINEVWTNIASD